MGWREIAEAVGTMAVVLSLVYVGVQVNQNTRAIHTATSQSVYDYHAELQRSVSENPELAALLLRARDQPESITPLDSLRLSTRINLEVNLFESVYTSARLGTMESEMAAGWLRGLSYTFCDEQGRIFWTQYGVEYHPDFVAAVDSVQSEFCPGAR